MRQKRGSVVPADQGIFKAVSKQQRHADCRGIGNQCVLHFIDEGRLSVVTGGFSKLKEPRRQVIRRTTRAENSQLEPEHEIELGNEEEE